MQIRQLLSYSATVAALATLAACGKPQQAGGSGGQMPPAEVGVMVVQAQTVGMNTELNGRTSPFAVAEIRPQVGGIIQKRVFNEGGEIKAGELLYQIDPATYAASLESAKAALARDEATLVSAKAKAERYKNLIGDKAISQQDLDDAQAAYKQAEASVLSDKAAILTAQINLGYTRVSSPISGRIGKSSVTQGALVTANQTTALATVQQLDPIYVDLTQSMSDLMRLKQQLASGVLKRAGNNQAKVQLVLEDGTVYPVEGKLAFTDVTVDQTSESVSLRAVFPNPKHELLPGMFVRARLETGARDQSILVPQQAVSHNTRGDAVVMLATNDGKFEQRVIKTEQTVGDQWLVSGGLKAGDQVIVEGLQRLRPGTVIKPVPMGSASAPAAR